MPFLSAVLVGTQDEDPVAARVSWLVLSDFQGTTFPSALWHSVVFAGRRTAQHRDPSVRAAAAAALRNLRTIAPAEQETDQLELLLSEYARDLCHSVRESAKRTS